MNTNQPNTAQKSTNKTLIVVLLIAIIVVVGVIAGILIHMYGGGSDSYAKYMDKADKYADSMDYDSAISNYWAAIELEPNNERPYIELGNLYQARNMLDDAYMVYSTGYTRTASPTLLELMNSLRRNSGDPEQVTNKDVSNASVTFNKATMLKFAGYTFADYRNDFGQADISVDGDVYTVRYPNVGATFQYYNTSADQYVVDTVNKKPMDSKQPNEIHVTDLSLVFPGFTGTMNETDIENCAKNMNYTITELGRTTVPELSKTVIRFVFEKAIFEIECDANGNFTPSAWNRITPTYVITPDEEDQATHKLTGLVVDAVNGEGVFSAVLSIAKKEAPNTEIAQITSGVTGSYLFEDLEAGDYIVTVSKEGYITDRFAVTVYERLSMSEYNLLLSPELQATEIRIVLSWNDQPQDLDSYLDGVASDGTEVHTSFMDPTAYSGNTLLAELDIDDTDGNGPETTTIYDSNGNYTFTVEDYGHTGTMGVNGATVRIYVGSAAPIVVEVPSNVQNVWKVCTINNGVVNVVNTAGD